MGRFFVPFLIILNDKCFVTKLLTRRWSNKNSLSLKLLIATWAISSLATLIFTVGQLVFDFNKDLSKLKNNFAIIQNTYLDSISEHVWSYDTRLLEIQMDGISQLPGLSYLKLTADDKVIYTNGKSSPTSENHKTFNIVHKGTNEFLGKLDVELDIDSLKQHYLEETFWIFVRQGAKTLLVVLVLSYVFNNILVVHIQDIAAYLKKGGSYRQDDLILNRRPGHREDDLDFLVSSINLFRSELLDANTKLEQLNQALEQKILDRTYQLTIKNESLEKAMQQIKRMQATLVAQEKLASLGNLTASVAHEIRNPLNFVLNFSELLGETQDMKEIAEISKVIQKHGQRIDRIVRSMQILSGYENDILTDIDLNELIKKALSESLALAHLSNEKAKPQVIFNLEDHPKLKAYENSLTRALQHIFDNALDAMDKKTSTDSQFQPELTISTHVSEENIEIHIKDNGTGISPSLGDKIFDPFLSTKLGHEGAGLGLTVSANIAQKHGGSLKYNSEFGKWTDFILTLPIKEEGEVL